LAEVTAAVEGRATRDAARLLRRLERVRVRERPGSAGALAAPRIHGPRPARALFARTRPRVAGARLARASRFARTRPRVAGARLARASRFARTLPAPRNRGSRLARA